jgi:predicted transcriptional regulator
MDTVKDMLRSYFLNGNTGSNEKLANLMKCSQSTIRGAIKALRDEGLPIERPVFRAIGNKAVYRLSDEYYTVKNPTAYQDRRKGRPAHWQALVVA